MKKILAINDLTVTSKAAMQFQASIIPLFGHELNMLPTTLYSTHLGFKEVASLDCQAFLAATLKKFIELKINFSAYYLGLLGAEDNIETLINLLPKEAKIYFDPIMGDEGRLYSLIKPTYPKKIRPLVKRSYLITPNYFEACLILDKPYTNEYREKDIKACLVELASLGPQIVVITGVKINNLLGSYLYAKDTNDFVFYGKEKINYNAHGTGDIFSSCLLGSLEKDNDYHKALKLAVDFTYSAILKSETAKIDPLYGLAYEPLLTNLI